MIKWPSRASSAIRKLFEPLQEIDVYVEDINDEAFYRSLLNKVTNDEIKISRVFSLGNCAAVIKAAEDHDQNNRRALFIIDGDLSWTKGEPAPLIAGLHRHDAYCIENLILCERALSLLVSQDAILIEEEAIKQLAYGKWIESVKEPLLELFSAFATVHEFDSTIATVSKGVGIMCINDKKSSPKLDREKVKIARDEALISATQIAASEIVLEKYENVLNRLKELPNPLMAISGKDFLVPLIDFHLQSLGCRIKRKSLRIRLACAGDTTRFSHLKNALREAAKGNYQQL